MYCRYLLFLMAVMVLPGSIAFPDTLCDGFEEGKFVGWTLYNNDPWAIYNSPYVGVSLGYLQPLSGSFMAIMPHRDYYAYTAARTLANPEYGTLIGHVNLAPGDDGGIGPGVAAIRIYDNSRSFVIYTNVNGNGKVAYYTAATSTVSTNIDATAATWHEIKFVTSQSGTQGYWDGQLLYTYAAMSQPVHQIVFGSSWGSAAAAYDNFSFPSYLEPTPYVNDSPPPALQESGTPFFPLGFYDHYMYNTEGEFTTRYATQKSQGMNTIMLWGSNWACPNELTFYALNAALTHNLKMFVQIHHYAMTGDPAYPLTLIDQQVDALWFHPALIGWYLFEEPENWGIFPDTLQSRYARVRSHDFAARPMAVQHNGPVERYLAVEPPPTSDILVSAFEPCVEGMPEFAGPMWKAALMARDYVLLAKASGKLTVINHVQAHAIHDAIHAYRRPTLPEIRYLTYGPIIEGARGALYWDWGQGPEYDQERIEYDQNVVAPVATEINSLIPVIVSNSTAVSVASDRDIDTTGHSINDVTSLFGQDANGGYLLVANHTPNSFTVTFELTGEVIRHRTGSQATEIDVLFENRVVSLAPVSGATWTITDSFSPFDVNVYHIYGPPLPAPQNCDEVKDRGYNLSGDLSGDCQVNMLDFSWLGQDWNGDMSSLSEFIQQWLQCSDPGTEYCQKPWQAEL